MFRLGLIVIIVSVVVMLVVFGVVVVFVIGIIFVLIVGGCGGGIGVCMLVW